ncbi:LPXTG cell wall anchor domain-containing protein [Vagococcus luciliae]|uniref:Gram-positive cocci surface proteins LPxTG domain-containing protein n=1 Tax=Vagococcus luciliae TaxID=2920380 RepID=A0ABY5NWZ4_9ENTE|nr:LPXTG cell wall anchor domain-containing protein [Vagococcus luciliae]UUV98162.1 hypothetical protein G314FT_02530 [Vagococcus luciliae]
MKKKVYIGLFSALLLVGGTSVYSLAEETTDEVKTEDVAKEQGNNVKPNLGKVTLIGYTKNEDNQDFSDYAFSVPKPAEFQGLKLGELTLVNVPYSADNKNLIGATELYHTVLDGKFDTKIRYGIYDEGDQLRFQPILGNVNVGQANYPGKVGLTPFIGGEIGNGNAFFETPNGTYSAFIRVIFTNVPQPSDDENNDTNNAVVEQPENSTSNSQNQTDSTDAKDTTDNNINATKQSGTTNPKNSTDNNTTPAKQNEKEFVNNIKKTGDTSEKYANNKKLPQTSQSNTVLPGLMLLLLGSVTAVFAKFKFSTK